MPSCGRSETRPGPPAPHGRIITDPITSGLHQISSLHASDQWVDVYQRWCLLCMQAIQEREDGQGEARCSVCFCGEEVQDPAPVPLLRQPEWQCQVQRFSSQHLAALLLLRAGCVDGMHLDRAGGRRWQSQAATEPEKSSSGSKQSLRRCETSMLGAGRLIGLIGPQASQTGTGFLLLELVSQQCKQSTHACL